MGKKKKQSRIFSVSEYMKECSEYIPSVSTQHAKAIINRLVKTISGDTINQTELDQELQKINPSILALLCNAFQEYGYDSF